MNTALLFLMLMLITFTSFAQNGINYKAVIKDHNGNVIANQQITLRFSIFRGTSRTPTYSETHAPITDAYGLMIANIGEGTPSIGIFNNMDWGSDRHYLNDEVDTGSGMVNFGTTEFKAVPYALNVTGLEAIDEGNGIGRRLKGYDSANYGNIGFNAVDLSYNDFASSVYGATGLTSIATGSLTIASGEYATAMGYLTTASGVGSTTMGSGTEAIGVSSTAMGSNTEASGTSSTAMGRNSIASGHWSTSMGFYTEALGDLSTSMGRYTKASSYASTAIGAYNTSYGGNPTIWVDTDPIFEIGNGTNSTNLSNAMTVLKNGNVGIGISSPQVKLQITNGSEASLSGGSGYLVIGNQGSTNLVFDTNEIMARNTGGISPLYLQRNGGSVFVGAAVVHSSDKRLKENITELAYGLNEILQLQPKSYHWKNRDQSQKSFGLIAQELQPIIKELVLVQDDKEKTLSVNYTELIPVLIKAIQEQQQIIDQQNSKIEGQRSKINGLTAELNHKKETLNSFNQRLDKMEAIMTANNQ